MPAKATALLEDDVRALTLRLALPGLLAMTARLIYADIVRPISLG